MKSHTKAAVVAVLVTAVLAAGTLGGATATAATDGDGPNEKSSTSSDHVVEIGRQDVEIRDLTVTISDTHIEGTGLPAASVEDASYTIEESTIETDGFVVEHEGTDYRFCKITITIDDVGLQFEDVSTDGADA